MTDQAISLLKALIAIPSASRDEAAAAAALAAFIEEQGFTPQRTGCNVWMTDLNPSPLRPTLLLSAHLDTVPPAQGWTTDPYTPIETDGRLYGLGASDCGGGLVCLLCTFIHFQKHPELPRAYNLVFCASAEEEVSGAGGITSVLPLLPHIDCAIVGEPTSLQPAAAERGLIVIDCINQGRAAHAARPGEGLNALYEAMDDIQWLRSYKFERVSPLLGETIMTATIIQAGTKHNILPEECRWTIDCRPNELYTLQEVLQTIQDNVKARCTPRSLRLQPSSMPKDHPLLCHCRKLGLTPFGSPTLSDQALMPWPSLKLGPGHSCLSHTPNEYLPLEHIPKALQIYNQLITLSN